MSPPIGHSGATWRIRLNLCFLRLIQVHIPNGKSIGIVVLGRQFVKRFALCYRTVVCLSVLSVCPACPVCDVGILWPNGCMDQDATWYGGRPRPRPYCVRCGPNSPLSNSGIAPNFRTISIVAKRLDGSRCQLVRR